MLSSQILTSEVKRTLNHVGGFMWTILFRSLNVNDSFVLKTWKGFRLEIHLDIHF